KAEIHRIISRLAAEGIAIILISDDAREVIGMADRIIVFRGGYIAAESVRSSFDREAILLAAAHTARTLDGWNPAPATVSGPAHRARLRGFTERLIRVRELGLVLALLIICLAVAMREPRFLQGANLQQ